MIHTIHTNTHCPKAAVTQQARGNSEEKKSQRHQTGRLHIVKSQQIHSAM